MLLFEFSSKHCCSSVQPHRIISMFLDSEHCCMISWPAVSWFKVCLLLIGLNLFCRNCLGITDPWNEVSKVVHFILKNLAFFSDRAGMRLLFLESSANRNSAMASLTHIHRQSKTKPSDLTQRPECRPVVLTLSTTDWSSLSDRTATPEPRFGGVCSCWCTHPTDRQPAVPAFQWRPRFDLWPAASPQWVGVWGGSQLFVHSLLLNSSWHV